MNDPSLPAVQTVYWVDMSILPASAADGAGLRPVVVMAAPPSTSGTVTVVVRSGADRFGVEHGVDTTLGLASAGRFSRRYPVQAQSWAAGAVAACGRLDDATFAAVVERFGW